MISHLIAPAVLALLATAPASTKPDAPTAPPPAETAPTGTPTSPAQPASGEPTSAKPPSPGVTAAVGDTEVAPPAATVATPVPVGPTNVLPRLGMVLDAGVPDGVGVSALYRPRPWVRFHAGVTTNIEAPGVRAGVSLVPYLFFITPALTAEVGLSFEANVNRALGRFGISSNEPILNRVGYSYGNLHAGLELGHSHWCVFFVRVGLTYLQTTLHDAEAQLPPELPVTLTPPIVRATFPSAKLGLLLYFW